MSRGIKITIAEPSEIIRRGISSIIKRIGAIHAEISEVGEMDQLKNTLGWQRPDILVINPSYVGMFSLAQIKKDAGNPDLKCIALQTAIVDALSLRAYDEVISVYDNSEQIKGKITRLLNTPQEDKSKQPLSQREKEVVAYVVKGMTNKQIADKLCLSAHTVITHRRNISAKLDIHSTAGLTIYAIVNKLIELRELDSSSDSEIR